MYKEMISQIKEEQKEMAKDIRKKKSQRKQHEYGWVPGLFEMRRDYRHRHIAYCLLRGTPYERIENPSKYNKPNMDIVKSIMEHWTEEKTAA
jgi:hypothetical protein